MQTAIKSRWAQETTQSESPSPQKTATPNFTPSTFPKPALPNLPRIVPEGLWANSTNMWVTDGTKNRAYAYRMTGEEWGEADNDKNISLDLGHRGDGIWGNETNIWISDTSTGDLLPYKNGWSTVTAVNTIEDSEAQREITIFGEHQPAIDFGSLKKRWNPASRTLRPFWKRRNLVDSARLRQQHFCL